MRVMWFAGPRSILQRLPVRRATLALALASAMTLAVTLLLALHRHRATTTRLQDAAQQLDALTEIGPADDGRRAAIAWGYAERLRLGLESPFRLIESAARDTRLAAEERRTVSWALLSRVIRGESHQVDPAALDLIGPSVVEGEQHVALIDQTIKNAENPRAAELALRLAYALASAERLVDGSAPTLVAEVAALIADGEIARREAVGIARTSGADPVAVIRRRRAARGIYVERPVLLVPDATLERAAVQMAPALLASVRGMRPIAPLVADSVAPASDARQLADELLSAGSAVPPMAPLQVTVQRYLGAVRMYAPGVDASALRRVANSEMLLAATRFAGEGRSERRTVGRLLVASAVAMRTLAQEPVWFPGDSTDDARTVGITLGVASIGFDRDVPPAWRPYLLQSLALGVKDLRRILPSFTLSGVNVRFRMTAPADSALAMHDPRSRTLHLPAHTAGGALLHELAHELDRQSAIARGLPGYRSDAESRPDASRNARSVNTPDGRIAAALRALTEEAGSLPRMVRKSNDRPAEIFATRVDWVVTEALARLGISNGFLSGVQDELLTGHAVHPERLRTSGRSASVLDALQGMTTVNASARSEQPHLQTLLRWSIGGPVDRRVASEIVRGRAPAFASASIDERCSVEDARVALVRLAAESRARGWLRQRARWISVAERPGWAHAMLGDTPWDPRAADERIAELREHVLIQLADGVELPAGLGAYGAPLASQARCGRSK